MCVTFMYVFVYIVCVCCECVCSMYVIVCLRVDVCMPSQRFSRTLPLSVTCDRNCIYVYVNVCILHNVFACACKAMCIWHVYVDILPHRIVLSFPGPPISSLLPLVLLTRAFTITPMVLILLIMHTL